MSATTTARLAEATSVGQRRVCARNSLRPRRRPQPAVPETRRAEPRHCSVGQWLTRDVRLRVRPGQPTVAFRIDRRDLALWLRQLLPVVLIVYDGRKDIAYWLYVQSYFRRLPGFNLFAAGQTVTVHVPTANVVTPAAVRKFGRFRDQVIRQTREVIHDEEATDPLR